MSIKSLSSQTKNYLILAGLLLMSVLTYYMANVVAPFLISLILAYVLNPFVRFMVRKKIPRPLAVIVVFLLCLTIFVVFVVPMTVSILAEAAELINRLGRINVRNLADNFKSLGQVLYEMFDEVPFMKEQIDSFIQSDEIREFAAQGVILVKDSTLVIFNRLMGFMGSAFSGMINLVLIPVLVFYVLLDLDEIYKSFCMLVPPDYRSRFKSICNKIDIQLHSLLRGQLLANTGFAIMMTIGLWASGLNFYLFLGPIAGIANFIPYLGGLFTVIFATLVAIAQFGISKAFLSVIFQVAIVITIIQTIDAWFVQPSVVGENAGLHPLIVMLALAIAGSIGGIPGMIMAVPLTVILKVLGKELYEELYETDSADSDSG